MEGSGWRVVGRTSNNIHGDILLYNKVVIRPQVSIDVKI